MRGGLAFPSGEENFNQKITMIKVKPPRRECQEKIFGGLK